MGSPAPSVDRPQAVPSSAAALPAHAPEKGEPFKALLADIDRIILPGVTHWQSPNFYAYFPCNASGPAILGDLLSSGLGVQGMLWATSPACTELETHVLDWLVPMLGLPSKFLSTSTGGGVIQDTASSATLCALLCARERASNYSLARGGLQGEEHPLIVYVSSHSHSSVEKAALLAGFGRVNLHFVAVDENYAMKPAALEDAIRSDIAQGFVPCAVVGTTGTTGTTALDPIQAIANIAHQYKIWFHVDSALAGSAMILPECRWMWDGIEGADSLVLNPHKWLGAAFDCSLYYVRDPEHLVRVMSTNPSYLQSTVDNCVKNLRDWGIPLGRRFRSLKLWFLIREQGIDGLQARLRRDLANAQWFAEQVRNAPAWHVLAPVPLQTVFRRAQSCLHPMHCAQ